MGNHRYTSKIITPNMHKLLKLSKDEVKEIEKIHIAEGKTIIKDTSHFTGYVCDVGTYEEVNSAYEAVRYKNLNARHIIWACVLPGTDVVSCFNFNDDGEHEAGTTLLDYMVKTEQKSRAIFIVREYDGKHIGPL